MSPGSSVRPSRASSAASPSRRPRTTAPIRPRSITTARSRTGPAPVPSISVAPALAPPDLQGTSVRLAERCGKVALVCFWRTLCPDCREELPSVNWRYHVLKQEALEVLLASFRESAAPVKRTAAERGYVAPVLLDESGEVTGKLYGVWGPPTAYFVDRQGQLLGRLVGPHDWSAPAARKLVEALLAAPPAKR